MLSCIAALAHPFDRYLQNCCVLYNLINTKLYDSRVSNAQLIMQQLTGIDNLVTIRVTTYSDGTRSTDKILK